ncbi:hypothetical protein [Olivibacter sitiensis]|nr:hypothetical protein [Olivibacter sitiensis]
MKHINHISKTTFSVVVGNAQMPFALAAFGQSLQNPIIRVISAPE